MSKFIKRLLSSYKKGQSQCKKTETKIRYDFKYKALESFVKATSGKEARNTSAV